MPSTCSPCTVRPGWQATPDEECSAFESLATTWCTPLVHGSHLLICQRSSPTTATSDIRVSRCPVPGFLSSGPGLLPESESRSGCRCRFARNEIQGSVAEIDVENGAVLDDRELACSGRCQICSPQSSSLTVLECVGPGDLLDGTRDIAVGGVCVADDPPALGIAPFVVEDDRSLTARRAETRKENGPFAVDGHRPIANIADFQSVGSQSRGLSLLTRHDRCDSPQNEGENGEEPESGEHRSCGARQGGAELGKWHRSILPDGIAPSPVAADPDRTGVRMCAGTRGRRRVKNL